VKTTLTSLALALLCVPAPAARADFILDPASDLTPLRGLGLQELSILSTPARDLSPLQGLALKRLRLDYRADRAEFLRSFTGLETINDKSAADFWKEVDGK